MDPFHVVRLAGEALDQYRRRVQQDTRGHRGRTGHPLYGARRTLHTGADPLTDKQKTKLAELFGGDPHVQVEASWRTYQQMIAPYRQPDRALGHQMMNKPIQALSAGVPAAPTELSTPGRTLKRRATDVRTYSTRPGTSNGPTETINSRLEHLRGSAPGLPLPHQLHRPIPAGGRWLQTPTTPSMVKSRIFSQCRRRTSLFVRIYSQCRRWTSLFVQWR